MSKRVPIIQTVAALESLRSRGITLPNGIGEGVDNSVDWGATRIHIELELDDDEQMTVRIADDASGIVEWVNIDDKGMGQPVSGPEQGEDVIPGMLQALRVGGRISRPHRNSIGRFGFGLPQTALALSPNTRLYSKVRGGAWRYATLDIKKLKSDLDPETFRPLLAPVISINPSEADFPRGWDESESGTLLIFEDIPKSTHHISNLSASVDELRTNLGRIYRYPIEAGLEIYITTPDDIDANPIPPQDPLCMMRGSKNSRFGPIDDRGVFSITFDGKSGTNRPLITDSSTGIPAEVVVRFVRIEPKRFREELGIPLDAGARTVAKGSREYGFNLAGQGFSLVRGDREIGHAETFGLFTKEPTHNYFRGEIRFPPIKELDRYFGIEPDKAKYRMNGRMVQWMQPARKTISDILKATQKALKNMNPITRERSSGTSRSGTGPPQISITKLEHASVKLKEIAPPRQQTESHEVLRNARKQLEKGDRDTLELEYAGIIEAARNKLEESKAIGDNIAIQDCAETLSRLEGELEQARSMMDARFSEPAYFRIHERPKSDDTLYWVKNTDEGPRVVLNENTPFYRYAYARARAHPRVEALMTLMLWSIAYSDHDPTHSEEKKEFWNRVRPLISRTSGIMLSLLDDEEEDDVPLPRRTKRDVIISICEISGIEQPGEVKGGTVTRKFLVDLVEHLGGIVEKNEAKHSVFIKAYKLLGYEYGAEKHLSTGATVTLSGILALESALERRV